MKRLLNHIGKCSKHFKRNSLAKKIKNVLKALRKAGHETRKNLKKSSKNHQKKNQEKLLIN